MNLAISLFIASRELLRRFHRGQTMAEYGLILGAIAVAVFAVYQQMGTTINNMVTWQDIDGWLLGGSGS